MLALVRWLLGGEVFSHVVCLYHLCVRVTGSVRGVSIVWYIDSANKLITCAHDQRFMHHALHAESSTLQHGSGNTSTHGRRSVVLCSAECCACCACVSYAYLCYDVTFVQLASRQEYYAVHALHTTPHHTTLTTAHGRWWQVRTGFPTGVSTPHKPGQWGTACIDSIPARHARTRKQTAHAHAHSSPTIRTFA